MLMRRRLYFVLPDVLSARAMRDDLLLARIEYPRMHFLSRRDTLPDDLPQATVLQKTDIVHGAQVGAAIGGVVGALAGALIVLFPPEGVTLKLVAVLAIAIGGALFGAWASSMVASSVPNSRLRAFESDMEKGKVLMMVDVPMRRAQEVSELIRRRHPEALAGGFEPTIPAFP
ncbi:MAG TPA: DUF1269 domain-containing protein [Burkholderiales bacterium]|jgi:hypothetical protein|nr:DUF1269 domain-containing protein [Burkholderiales bacterium]